MTALRISLAQCALVVGDIEHNCTHILTLAQQACEQGSDLVLFPEQTLIGYPAEDLLLRPSVQRRIEQALERLCQANLPIALVVGYPIIEQQRRYNRAAVIESGRIVQHYDKQHLPVEQVFDEPRYFTPGQRPCIFEYRGFVLALTLCEDLWHDETYPSLAAERVDVQLTLNASPYYRGRPHQRYRRAQQIAARWQIATAYLNPVYAQDELVFDGHSFVCSSKGEIAYACCGFEPTLATLQLHRGAPQQVQVQVQKPPQPVDDEAELYQALILGLRDYVQRNGFAGVLLGLSGGIDSALSLALAVDALGPQAVSALMLPYRYTSTLSLNCARQQAKQMGVRYHELPIAATVDASLESLQPLLAGHDATLAQQNIQARARGLLLMTLSNAWGCMLLTTGNKSELAVGYATLYGDMCGGFNALKDVSKTWVYRLAAYRNRHSSVIPQAVLQRAPSAELAANQHDSDSLPPYAQLDAIMEQYVEQDRSYAQIVASGFEAAAVRQVLQLIDRSEYKRRQAPLGTRVTPRGFGRDRRYPISQRWPLGE